MFVIPIRLAEISHVREKQKDALWVKFDPEQIGYLVRSDKVVVIDITADWCITCKLNKALVLTSDEVINKLKEPNIVAMRGDLTKSDEVILAFMRTHNRYGIPFNIVYGPHAQDGVLASELLDKDSLLKAIEQAK
jgi:suppressor for copper-sensitivity B